MNAYKLVKLTIRPLDHFYIFQFANIPTRIITADTLLKHSYYLTCRIDIGLSCYFTPSSSLDSLFPNQRP